MTNSHPGIYLDGLSAREKYVFLTLGEQDILIHNDGHADIRWQLNHVLIEKEYDRESGRAVLSCKDFPGARLVLADHEFYKDVILLLPRPHAFVIPFTWKSLSALSLISVLFLIAGFYFIRHESRILAPFIPQDLQAMLVDQIVASQKLDKNSCMATKVKTISKISAKIAADNNLKQPKIYIFKDSEINAYALPAETILINQGLIDAVESEDALAGIIAHEMGHLAHHHPQELIVNAIGMQAFMVLTVGSTDLGAIARLFHDISYSRSKEMEADDEAQKFMVKSHINPNGLANFFSETDKDKPAVYAELEDYLSTHPTTQDRVKKFYVSGNTEYQHILSEDEWAVIKQNCY